MDLMGIQRIMAAGATLSDTSQMMWGLWDGTAVWFDDVALTASNAAGPLRVGQRVFCLLDQRQVTILGPTTTIPLIDCGAVTEVGAGVQTSWVPFGIVFPSAPVVTVTIASAAGSHTWDAPRATNIGPTGFSLLTKNGANCIFNWIAVQKEEST